jgi:putative chitinase
MDWLSVLQDIAPRGDDDILAGLAEAAPVAIEKFALTTPLRRAHFLSQWAQETAGYTRLVEIASGDAYEGRRDLGNARAGDGIRFKGRGLCMLTGRANYARLSKLLVVDFLSHPEIVTTFPHALDVAGVYWRDHSLNVYADRDDATTITRRINGGLNGLRSRLDYLARAKRALR